MIEKIKCNLKAMEMTCWMRCCGLTLQDRVLNEEIRGRIGVPTSTMDVA